MPFLQRAKRYFGSRIHGRVAALVVACVLPVSLFAGYLTIASFERGRRVIEQSLSAAAQTQMRVVEGEIAAVEASLRSLATSPNLDRRDYAGFYGQAQEVLRQSPGLNIVLLGVQGEQILNTLQPFGTVLPTTPPPLFSRLMETRRPVLSDLFFGPVTGRPLISLAVPTMREGRMTTVLGMSLDAEHLAPILHQEDFPATWMSAIFDSSGTIVARTREPEKYVGQKAGPWFLTAFRTARQGLIETDSVEGIPLLAAYSRSDRYGWTVAVAVPRQTLEAELRRSLWLSLAGGVGLLLVGLILANRISRGITHPVRTLMVSAEAIGNGDPIPAQPLRLQEAEDVRRALVDAAALIRKRTAERDIARTNEFEIQQQHRALRALNDIAALPGANADRQVVDSLRLGAWHFGLPLGIVSRIEDGVYTVVHHCAPKDGDAPADGRHDDLSRTCCALTWQADSVVAIPHLERSDPAGHPRHAAFGPGAYIGAPLYVRNRRFGTVNFSSAEPLGRDFDEADKEFMRLLTRWIGTVIERQMSDAEIAAARQDLERSNEELEQFAYVASHDLRQPLRMVSSYLTLIERRLGVAVDDDLKTFFGFAVGGAKRMDRMILDLLEYSRAGRHDTPLEPVALAEAVADGLANIELPVAEAEADVSVAADLPPVPGHRSELVRLFQNLIGNAIKYRNPDRAVRVEIRCRAEGSEWILAVRDNGIGIPAENRGRAFVLFQRLVANEAYEGTGIGLAVCKKIVEAHGGRIWMEDGLEGGTSVCFSLPKAWSCPKRRVFAA